MANTLPEPVGGTDGIHEVNDPVKDGALIDFRDNVLWKATAAVRTPIRDALGAEDPVADKVNFREPGAQIAENPAKEQRSLFTTLQKSKSSEKSAAASTATQVGKHRKQTDNPIGAAVKKVRDSVTAKPKQDDAPTG